MERARYNTEPYSNQSPPPNIMLNRPTFGGHIRCWEVFLFIQKLLAMRSSINAMNILGFSSQFVQIHKSYIINIQHLAMIDGDECIMYPPFNGERLPISSKYKKALQSSFIQL